MRVLDLFSGIGGFSLGLERTGGFETVAFCEVAPAPRRLLKHHWPEIPCYDDICTLTGERLAADGIGADVICGGFPCQDLSYAGKGAGLAGERSGLWFEFARLIRELRPRYVVVENVSALLSRGLGVVLGDLAASGYDAEWDCIPASAVGAPHRRDRIWIVAYARSEQHEGFGDAFRRSLASELHGATVADAERRRWDRGRIEFVWTSTEQSSKVGRTRRAHERRDVDDALRGRHGVSDETVCAGRKSLVGASWWATEPDVGRVADGVSARLDQLHGLGNAVVPQIPELIGRAILEASA